jgi:hypothetical protein
MVTFLAILASIWAFGKTICAAIPATVWIFLAGFAVCLCLCARCSCDKQVAVTYPVVSVPTGASIIVRIGALDLRRSTVSLQGIAAPSSGTLATASASNLAKEAGSVIRVEPMLGSWFAAHDSIQGVVYGDSGVLLQKAQLSAGLAQVEGKVPSDWTAAQALAQKNKIGLWRGGK